MEKTPETSEQASFSKNSRFTSCSSPIHSAIEETKVHDNLEAMGYTQQLEATEGTGFEAPLNGTGEDLSKEEPKVRGFDTENTMRKSELSPQAPLGVQETAKSPKLKVSPSHVPDFNQKTNPAADGGETRRQEEDILLKYQLCLPYEKIVLFLALWLLTNVPMVKHLLDKKIINSFTVGMLLSLVTSALAQFTIWRKFYTGALKALGRGAANKDLLMFLATSAAYFASLYSDSGAACFKDFKDTNFFGIISMLNMFIQLWESDKVRVSITNAAQVESERATSHIAPSTQMANCSVQQFTNRICKYFVLLVIIIISFATWFAWFLVEMLHGYPESWLPSSINGFELSIKFGISISLIDCFCAIELETPAAVMLANGIVESRGLMIKAGQALEIAHKVNCIIFNKTGTLTKPVVDDIKLLKEMDRQKLLLLIAAIEVKSEDPLASAIVDYAKQHIEDQGNPAWPDAKAFKKVAGCGVEGKVQNKEIIVGNRRFTSQKGIEIPPDAKEKLSEVEKSDKTGVLVSINKQVAGVLIISDHVKQGAKEVISTLKSMGMRIIVVTGDRWEVAKSLAKKVGIVDDSAEAEPSDDLEAAKFLAKKIETETVAAEAEPEDKAKQVRKYQDLGYTVAMVGQYINDSQALKAADVGIANVAGASGGYDIEAADVVLRKDNLEDVQTVIILSRKICRHRFWAFSCSILFIVAATSLPVIGFHFLPGICAAIMAASLVRARSSSLVVKKYIPQNLHIQEISERRIE